MVSIHTFKETEENCQLLYKWRSDPVTNRYSFGNVTSYDNFKDSFPSYFKDISPVIFYTDTIPVAYCGIYHTNIWQKEYVIGIMVNPDHRGKGYGKQCLNMAIKHYKNIISQDMIAEIKQDNYASIKIFESNGFIKFNEYTKNDCVVYQYRLNIRNI